MKIEKRKKRKNGNSHLAVYTDIFIILVTFCKKATEMLMVVDMAVVLKDMPPDMVTVRNDFTLTSTKDIPTALKRNMKCSETIT